MSTFMKSRQWIIALGLLTLVLAAIVGSFLTRDEGTVVATNTSKESTEEVTLVDERPLQTARAMAKLATSPDEQRVANEAVELADDQVDLAFHDASRDAADHPAIAKPENRELFQHASEAEEQVKVDQDLVNKLKKQVASAGPGTEDKLQGQLDVAQAQLELDQDELGDAKEDLIRSGADPGSLIQRQFAQHQAVEHGSDAKNLFTNSAEVNYEAGSLLAQIKAWRELREKAKQLQQARSEAGAKAATLSQAHEALDKQVVAEKARRGLSASAAATKASAESGQGANVTGSADEASSAIK